jgi:hypothetical protein
MERFAAVAVAVFFISRGFSIRLPEMLEEKHGVVPESVGAARLLRQHPFG